MRFLIKTLSLLLLISLFTELSLEARSVDELTAVIDSVVATNATCGLDNGTITIFASGGANIRYSINGGTSYQDENYFEGLNVDNYLVQILTGTTCLDINTATILNNPSPDLPILDCPEQFTIDCLNDPLGNLSDQIALLSALNFNGEEIPVVPSTPLTDLDLSLCGLPQIIELVSTDTCMGVSTCSLDIIVLDENDPTIICPMPLDVFIGNPNHLDVVEIWQESVTRMDPCSSNLSTMSDLNEDRINFECDSFFIIPVIFEGFDGCGNTSSCSTQLNVTNELAPVVTCDENFTIDCDADLEVVQDTFLIQFEDISSFDEDVTVEEGSNIEDIIGLMCGEAVTVNFVVIDGCERATNCSSVITIQDTMAPRQDPCPEPLIINAVDDNTRDDIVAWLEAIPDAEDNCSIVDNVVDFDTLLLQDLCAWPDTVTVSFIASDRCGNSSFCESQLFVQSNAVQISCQGDLTVECSEPDLDQIIDDWLMMANATDQDGNSIAVNNNFDLSALEAGCSISDTITFEVQNNCGSLTDCQSTLNIEDTTIPQITCPPSNQTFNTSDGDIELLIGDWLALAESFDLCNIDTLSNDFEFEQLTCNKDTTVVFTAMDLCGLTATCSAELSIINDLSVQLTCPQDTTFLCAGQDNMALIERLTTELSIDASTEVEVFETIDDFDPLECGSTQIITLEFSAIDECNNVADCTFTTTLLPNPQVYLPNVFSINAMEEENRTFGVFGGEAIMLINDVLIYDRYGNLVREAINLDTNQIPSIWDGRINGEVAEQGVYAYRVRYTDINGVVRESAGSFTLLR